MSAPSALRVGWCPGALRPMQAGDGLLVRVKPRGLTLPLDRAGAIADLSARFGNGVMTITGRANLQLRGVAEDGLDALVSALAALDLLDATPEGEAVRNVVASPCVGAPGAMEIRADVAALERRLSTDPSLWRLPAKFAWVTDDGGPFGLGEVAADVRFEARQDRKGFAIRLGPDRTVVADCGVGEVAEAAGKLADAFLRLCAENGISPHRMRDLTAQCGAAALFRAAGFASRPDRVSRRRPASPPIGLSLAGPDSWVGLAPAFGRLEAVTLARVVEAALGAGADALGLTPWRGLLVAGLGASDAQRLWAALASKLGPEIITDPADPRLRVAACSGMPACIRATTPVQEDASRLARVLGPGTTLHVSGCGKGCAHPAAATLTLVGRDGRYDLVRDGKAGEPPVLRGLSVDTVSTMVTPIPSLAEPA